MRLHTPVKHIFQTRVLSAIEFSLVKDAISKRELTEWTTSSEAENLGSRSPRSGGGQCLVCGSLILVTCRMPWLARND